MNNDSSHTHQQAKGHHIAQAGESSTAIVGDVHIHTRSQTEELHEYLDRAVKAYEARMYQLAARPPAPPDQPYKFLYAFEIEDADIFFGRDTATEALHQTVLKDCLTILHAKSGAGKTSLLNAGLSPRLIREARLPVYARAYEDPVLAIKRAIAPPSLGPWPELLHKLTLHELLSLACGYLSRQTQELVVILDQFEEFFVFWPGRDHRQPLIDALADCYEDKSLPIRFVIALRKDFYSDLADFQGRVPTILYNEYRLDAMNREEAQAAITGPAAKLSRQITYEQTLLDTLLDDLVRGGLELPHLQVVCTQLYETLTEGETIITLASYEELGRAEGVLGGYLSNVLDRLPGRGESIAREVLKELVSSEATKRVLSYDTLAARIEAGGDELKDILARLVDARLLRRDEVAGEIVYEMAHEHLIEEIRKWIDPVGLEFKQAEELLTREVATWHAHDTLIPRDRLELLYAHRERFRGLNDEAWECILRSALQADFAVADWAKLVSEVGERLLLRILSDADAAEMRQRVAEALGQLGSLGAVEALVAALRDENGNVRRIAAEALVKIGAPSVESLSAVLRDSDEMQPVRQEAARALGKLDAPGALEALTATLRVQEGDSRVRQAAAEALGQIGEPAVELLIAVLQDRDIKVRRAAARALVEIGRPAVKPLIAALRDWRWDVRWAAAGALGEIGDPHAVEPLIAALRDSHMDVHLAAVGALTKIGTPVALAAVDALE